MIIDKFQAGERWAVVYVTNRVFGRVPLEMSVDVTMHEELIALSDDQLLARLDALRAEIAGVNPGRE